MGWGGVVANDLMSRDLQEEVFPDLHDVSVQTVAGQRPCCESADGLSGWVGWGA